LIESLEDWILQLPNVTKASHRLGGTEFRVHGLEFMHTHGALQLDIKLSNHDQERVLRESKAEQHRAFVHHEAGWVTFRIRSEEDAENAKELIRLAYDNADKTMATQLSERAQNSS
jgi:luciferase-like monooxygenase